MCIGIDDRNVSNVSERELSSRARRNHLYLHRKNGLLAVSGRSNVERGTCGRTNEQDAECEYPARVNLIIIIAVSQHNVPAISGAG